MSHKFGLIVSYIIAYIYELRERQTIGAWAHPQKIADFGPHLPQPTSASLHTNANFVPNVNPSPPPSGVSAQVLTSFVDEPLRERQILFLRRIETPILKPPGPILM